MPDTPKSHALETARAQGTSLLPLTEEPHWRDLTPAGN